MFSWNISGDSHIPELHTQFWDYVKLLEETRDNVNHDPNAIYSYTLKNSETNLHWGYTTYRGTRVEATYQNGKEVFTVTIPGLRNFNGGTHVGYIKLVKQNLPYRSWWEMTYKFDDDSIKVYAASFDCSLKEAVMRKANAILDKLPYSDRPEEYRPSMSIEGFEQGFKEDYEEFEFLEEFEDDCSPDK